jgi:hypothetical protein
VSGMYSLLDAPHRVVSVRRWAMKEVMAKMMQ